MAALREILDELELLLEPAAFRDYCPNGLQVEGRAEVERVVTGVSASAELFGRALATNADLVLTHHGLFWDGDDVRVLGARRDRLRLLLEADVSLAAYHLPLDAHPSLGNNVLLASGIGATATAPFAPVHGRAIGWIATFEGDGVTAAELTSRLVRLTGHEVLAFPGGPERVRSVGIVSGGGARNVQDAIAARLDAFITGEPAEWARALADESGIHFLAAGHHATEVLGVRALGEHLVARFGVAHSYVEIANPV
ncbi:MAG TPA: Nif3-like dinuclear metal center hexameric protein [Solirubrobacteraceae bacterium]|jgi:dinuclear metal center YbgI/SA1388 family protein|nr:Nif3-like dinuclear metal center hexameric protein [Solirubrobacteraceae bacterium]